MQVTYNERCHCDDCWTIFKEINGKAGYEMLDTRPADSTKHVERTGDK